MSHNPLPPPRKVHLRRIFFALPAMNDPLPADLKFRENTEFLRLENSLTSFDQDNSANFLGEKDVQ